MWILKTKSNITCNVGSLPMNTLLVCSGYKKTPETKSGYSFKISTIHNTPEQTAFGMSLLDIGLFYDGPIFLSMMGGKKIVASNNKKLLLII